MESSVSARGEGGRVPIVAIGASDGGVEALGTFFDGLPAGAGMAFVVLMHLSTERESNLEEVLQRHTEMRVRRVQAGTSPEPDAIYVWSAKQGLRIEGGTLELTEVPAVRGQRPVVDTFFRSLAHDQGETSIGIVLSGTGTDGARGVKAIAEHGGFALVQDPDDAGQEGMPRSTIGTGLVDAVEPADGLGGRLVHLWRQRGTLSVAEETDEVPEVDPEILDEILTRLYSETRHDFSGYERSIIRRGIDHRRTVTHCTTLSDYLERLLRDADEVKALDRELLVPVTHFFRGAEAFSALEQEVVPALFDQKGADDDVRVWSVGCATGEEVYSLAMILDEHARRLDRPPNVQLFATDIHEDSLETARVGLYPESVASDLTADRVKRYLEPEGTHFRVRPELREMVVFAEHDVLQDPPFSNLDLVSCRNLLRMLNREMQEHVFEILHYALRDEGYLFLGTSDSLEAGAGLFTDLDGTEHLFQRRSREGVETSRAGFLLRREFAPVPDRQPGTGPEQQPGESVDEMHRQFLLDGVASIVVNENYEIVHLTEPATAYLQYQGGVPTHNVMAAVPDELARVLRGPLDRALHEGTATHTQWVTDDAAERRSGVAVRVRPVGNDEGWAQILLTETDLPLERGRSEEVSREESDYTTQVETELQRTREQLRTTVEEYKTTTEELELANEELRSMNEELQSKKEEVEASKEELESVNEELKIKVEELRRSNSDLQNLMESTDIATLFLDRDLCIKRFTPRVRELFRIRASDVGRSLSDFSHQFSFDRLIAAAQEVLDQWHTVEEEIETEEGRWFLVRIHPYQTVNGAIDGVVITFVDLTSRKEAELRLREERNFVDSVIDTVGALVVVMDPEGRIVRFNEECESITGYSAAEVEGEEVIDLLIPSNEVDELGTLFSDLVEGTGRTEYENDWLTKDGERRRIRWSNTVLRDDAGQVEFVVGTGIDVTERRRLEREVIAAADEERQRIGQDLHDLLASHLAGAAMMSDNLAYDLERGESITPDDVRRMSALIREGSEQARTLSHSLMPERVRGDELSDDLRNLAHRQEQMRSIACSFVMDGDLPTLRDEIASHLYRIASEAVNNAVKHADPDTVTVRLAVEDGHVVLAVRDDGVGIPADAESTDGIGLRTMEYRANLIGARLGVQPLEDRGTIVRCSLPLDHGTERGAESNES